MSSFRFFLLFASPQVKATERMGDPDRLRGFDLHGNPHLVYRGPIGVIRRFEWSRRWQIPHLWFADDRTWCVGSDIEADNTYVGGSVNLVERIVAAPELEALRVHPEDLAIVLGEWGIVR